MDKSDELGCKLAAKILLQDKSKSIITPNRDEWIGVGLLERDDELKRLSPKDNENEECINNYNVAENIQFFYN